MLFNFWLHFSCSFLILTFLLIFSLLIRLFSFFLRFINNLFFFFIFNCFGFYFFFIISFFWLFLSLRLSKILLKINIFISWFLKLILYTCLFFSLMLFLTFLALLWIIIEHWHNFCFFIIFLLLLSRLCAFNFLFRPNYLYFTLNIGKRDHHWIHDVILLAFNQSNLSIIQCGSIFAIIINQFNPFRSCS